MLKTQRSSVGLIVAFGAVACCTACDRPMQDARSQELSLAELQRSLHQTLTHRNPMARWQALSALTSVFRAEGEYQRLTAELEDFIATESDPDLIAQARLAQVRNDLLLDQPRDALARLEGADRWAEGGRWQARAMRLRADVQLALGDRRAALATFRDLAEALPEGDSRSDVRLELAERHLDLGELEIARTLLEANIALRSEIDAHLYEASERMLDWVLHPRGPAYEHVDSLVAALVRAAGGNPPRDLPRLMDESRFVAGPLGGHATSRDAAWLRSIYASSVGSGSRPIVPARPMRIEDDSGNDVFVLSYDWRGEEAAGDAWLQLVRGPDGWRWVGMWFTLPPRGLRGRGVRARLDSGPPVELLSRPVSGTAAARTLWPGRAAVGRQWSPMCPAPAGAPPDGQPLAFELRAPWAAGNSMLVGTWFLGDPTPVVGGECVDFLGWPGQYYMQGNHGSTPSENYAIDFTKWGVRLGVCPMFWPPFVFPCPWPWPDPGTPVASVAQGRVISVWTNRNIVRIEHLDDRGQPTGYRSVYMHMIPVLVQEGQFVARGSPLGIVGAQGVAEAHLHFHLERDIGTGYDPVMPSPMDGITLNWCGTRHCIRSSNGDLFRDDDSDGVLDRFDNCPGTPNPYVTNASGALEQPDSNGDGWGDACSCSGNADCSSGAYCDVSAGPPQCSAPVCTNDADCPGPTRCLGAGSGAYCTAPAEVLNCSDVNVQCLIGYEEPDKWCALSGLLDEPQQPEDDPCPSGRRHPASAHEAACLSGSNQLGHHLHLFCW